MEFIRHTLQAGCQRVKYCLAKAAEPGISRRTMERAASRLGLVLTFADPRTPSSPLPRKCAGPSPPLRQARCPRTGAACRGNALPPRAHPDARRSELAGVVARRRAARQTLRTEPAPSCPAPAPRHPAVAAGRTGRVGHRPLGWADQPHPDRRPLGLPDGGIQSKIAGSPCRAEVRALNRGATSPTSGLLRSYQCPL